jgi:hypothetical protein
MVGMGISSKGSNMTNNEMEEKIEEWQKSSSLLEVWEYLGISKESYFRWVESQSKTDLEEDADPKGV